MANLNSKDEIDTLPERPTRIQPYQFEPLRQDFERVPEHRIKLISLYPCGSLGQSINFVFGGRVGHFAATPQSDVVGIWSRDLGVVATLSVRQKMPFFVHI